SPVSTLIPSASDSVNVAFSASQVRRRSHMFWTDAGVPESQLGPCSKNRSILFLSALLSLANFRLRKPTSQADGLSNSCILRAPPFSRTQTHLTIAYY